MESGKDRPPASHPGKSELQRQSQLYAILYELNSLISQSRTRVAGGLFSTLTQITGVKSGRLFLADEQGKPDYCLVLVDGHLTEYGESICPPLREQALAGWVYRQRRGVLIDNTATDPNWPSWSQSPEASSAGSVLAFPILSAVQPIGAIVLISTQPHHFAETDLAMLTTVADHAAIIMENARLNFRLRTLTFLYEAGQAINSALNLDQIFYLLLERVRDLLKVDAASIALRDKQTGNLVFEAASGEGAADVLGIQLKPGQGIASWVAENGRPLIVQDAYNDPRFFADIDKKTGIKTEAILCIPIVLKEQVIGVIEALNPGESPFDEPAEELVSALANLAATAITNARLFARVRSAEARYKGLFEDSASPIIITDIKGIIIDVNRNACSLLGQTKDALRGANLSLLPSADGNLDFALPLDQIQTDKEVIFQTDIPTKEQRTTVEIKGSKVLVGGTPLIQWIGRDISSEAELEQIREDMTRMIIHDLRNPLTNIMNSIDVLYDVIKEIDESALQDDLFYIARRSGQRMHQLISSILDISRLETGQAILEPQPTDLVPLLHDVVAFIKPQTDIREISLTASLATNLPQVEIDPDMISRVVLNLLDNASKFTQIGGAINLTAKAMGSVVEIAVTDNGPGIPADQLQDIFKKFTRVQYKDGPEGAGLGLAFCELAVKAHNGHIWAESVLGQGTTIRFTLPMRPSPQSN